MRKAILLMLIGCTSNTESAPSATASATAVRSGAPAQSATASTRAATATDRFEIMDEWARAHSNPKAVVASAHELVEAYAKNAAKADERYKDKPVIFPAVEVESVDKNERGTRLSLVAKRDLSRNPPLVTERIHAYLDTANEASMKRVAAATPGKYVFVLCETFVGKDGVFTARGCIVPGEPTDYEGINAELKADVERRKATRATATQGGRKK